jgi:hypothetical protein
MNKLKALLLSTLFLFLFSFTISEESKLDIEDTTGFKGQWIIQNNIILEKNLNGEEVSSYTIIKETAEVITIKVNTSTRSSIKELVGTKADIKKDISDNGYILNARTHIGDITATLSR